ncbi:ATP-binding protein [Streptomyces albus]
MPYRNSDRWDGDRWDGDRWGEDRWGEDRWGEDRSGGTRRAPGNLRARLTSFVGREAEIAAIGTDLTGSRLVTLTGPGGSGKTRLAEEVAATAAAAAPAPYPDGTWLVELAPLDHPAAVPGAVLSALGRRVTALSTAATEGARSLGGEQDATGLLVEHLEHRTTLLVLDNCEHVIHAAATLAETLLAHCPGLTVLATSREPLGVPGEAVRPVEPLPPASAHRLFADRAAAASPGFRTGEDPAAVAEICRRLDGLPLAIELAAARLRSLTPRQIADRLDDRFRLLTSGSRTVLPRQQTLRAVVDWSWDLLDERERTVVRRLSVFAGGCTLSAAEHVCADGADDRADDGADDGDGGRGGADIRPDDVLDLLSALVDKSILVADQPPALAGTGVRYRMLETIHDYARERAAEHADDRDAAEDRHTAQILRFATAAEPRIRSAEQLSWLPRVEADLDNIRAALHRALRARDLETLAALVRAVGWFWWLRNYRDEGSGWAKSALSLLPAAPEERTGEEELLYREFQLLDCFLLAEHRTQELLTDPGRRAVAAELVAFFRTPGPASARFPGMLWPVTAHMLEGTRGLVASVRDTVAKLPPPRLPLGAGRLPPLPGARPPRPPRRRSRIRRYPRIPARTRRPRRQHRRPLAAQPGVRTARRNRRTGRPLRGRPRRVRGRAAPRTAARRPHGDAGAARPYRRDLVSPGRRGAGRLPRPARHRGRRSARHSRRPDPRRLRPRGRGGGTG